MLLSILGFIKYAVNKPGVQKTAFLWGLANGMALCRIMSRLAGEQAVTVQDANIGTWPLAIFDLIITPPIKLPDGWPQWLNDWGGWALSLLAIWFFVTRVLGWHPRHYVSFSGAANGGGGGGGGGPQTRRV